MSAPTRRRSAGTWLWAASALLVITLIAILSYTLLQPRQGGRMDPQSTYPSGAHALIALLRDHGVQVSVATTVDDVVHAARPDSLVVIAETRRILDPDLLTRLAELPGDRLLVEPTPRALSALAPALSRRWDGARDRPGCALTEANRAGTVDLGDTAMTYRANEAAEDTPDELVSCYGGAVVRYRDGAHTVTVAGSAEFMLNGHLLDEGNAALAMNLAGARSHVVWFAPQHAQTQADGGTAERTLGDLIPPNVTWVVLQLCVVVAVLAVWQGRRLGPLVAEAMPVVVRASETVEGRARLYRARRARDRAAEALRTAARQRLLPRLGLSATAAPQVVVAAVAQRTSVPADTLGRLLFGSVPGTDAELLDLARALDDIERQVTHL
ncbi:DUF4350 domain-containing protein [Mycolicibacillus trivialis]